MPLRVRQKLEQFGSGEIFYTTSRVDEQTGLCESVQVSQNIALPPKQKTDLSLMLKAGVPMQQVRCNLLDPVVVSGSVESVESKQGDEDAE